MGLDGLGSHVKAVRDLPVGPALCGQPCDAQLARGEGVHAVAAFPPRAATCGGQLLVGPASQRPGPAAGRQVKRLGERGPGSDPLPGPPQRCSQFGQGLRSLKQGRGILQDLDRLAQQPQPGCSALRQARDTQGDPERSPSAEYARVSELGSRQRPRAFALTEQQQRLGGAGTSVQVTDIADLHAPQIRAEHRHAGLEAGESSFAITSR